MFTDHEDLLMQKAIEKNLNLQLVIAIEELSELQKVLCKIIRFGFDKANQCDLFHEYADVQVMMEQIKIAFEIPDELLKVLRSQKIRRLEVYNG
jgi:hypothetical protein